MNLLLTGSSGFLGSRFLQVHKHKYNITVVNRKDLDLTDEASVYALFKSNHYDTVFHTAAMADVGMCENNPELAQKINVEATANIAKGCESTKSTLVFASSDQIYKGAKSPVPYTEDGEFSPVNLYAQNKLDAEKQIASILEQYFCLRLTWMFSSVEDGVKNNKNFFTNILNCLKNNTQINLFDNQFRGLTYVHEVIENFDKILHLPFGVYNAGSENNLSPYELGEWMLQCLGVTQTDLIQRAHLETVQDFRISNQKLKNYGVAFSDTKEAILKCIADMKEKPSALYV